MTTNFSPVLGVLRFKSFPKYCNVWYEGILRVSQWSHTGPSWLSCFLFPQCFFPFPNKPWFLRVCSTSLLKTLMEKKKLLVTSNFSFSISVFYPFGQLSAIYITIYNCHLQTLSVWKSLKLVVWEKVKRLLPQGCLNLGSCGKKKKKKIHNSKL